MPIMILELALYLIELFRNLRLDGNMPRFNQMKTRHEMGQCQKFAA